MENKVNIYIKDGKYMVDATIHTEVMRFVDPSDYRKGVVNYSDIYKQRDNKRL